MRATAATLRSIEMRSGIPRNIVAATLAMHEAATGAPMGGGVITGPMAGRHTVAVAGGSMSPVWPLEKVSSRVMIVRFKP
jgi:hypothetical protein